MKSFPLAAPALSSPSGRPRRSAYAGLVLLLALPACSDPEPEFFDLPADPIPCEFQYRDVCLHLSYAVARRFSESITIDTSLDDDCARPPLVAEGSPYCIVAGTTLEIPADVTVRAIGTRPLVLLASQTITIDGTLDVSSSREVVIPPQAAEAIGAGGGTYKGCQSFRRAPEGRPAGGGAGAGGTFAALGGAGGDGNYEDIPARDLGGLTPFDPEPAPTLLRPGCRGQDGAGAALGARGGRGGPAGGAVYVAAKAGITINGTIAANGAGGMGGGAQAGGGGGGSGGMISLEAPTVARNGKLFANGGGGGEGGIFAAGEVLGESGADGRQDTMFAAGGASALPGKGGDGGARSRPGGEDGTFTNEAGAGGGGGIGVIRVLGATTLGPAAVESPAVTVN
ncbi:MAG: hypothetical protein IPI49_14645 [Myxococcales bacterium]|nr:hypothetical protein [Myxococcales bacterium]